MQACYIAGREIRRGRARRIAEHWHFRLVSPYTILITSFEPPKTIYLQNFGHCQQTRKLCPLSLTLIPQKSICQPRQGLHQGLHQLSIPSHRIQIIHPLRTIEAPHTLLLVVARKQYLTCLLQDQYSRKRLITAHRLSHMRDQIRAETRGWNCREDLIKKGSRLCISESDILG